MTTLITPPRRRSFEYLDAPNVDPKLVRRSLADVALANALFGGTAEYVGLWFKSVGVESGFFWYVTGFFVLALVTAWAMPETRSESHLAREYGMAGR